MDMASGIAVVVALIAFLNACLALMRAWQQSRVHEKDVSALYMEVDRRTNGILTAEQKLIHDRFAELERRLIREVHERIGREIGDVRRALKGPPQGE